MRRCVLLVVLLGFFVVPNAGAAVSTCTYNASTKVVTMTMVDEFGAEVIRSGNAIRYIASNNMIPCGAATVKNTKRIDIKGKGASADTIAANYVSIDLHGGVLGPGSNGRAQGEERDRDPRRGHSGNRSVLSQSPVSDRARLRRDERLGQADRGGERDGSERRRRRGRHHDAHTVRSVLLLRSRRQRRSERRRQQGQRQGRRQARGAAGRSR